MPDSTRKDISIHTKPLETALPKTRGRGRPARIEQPPLPTMELSDGEQQLQTYFIEAYRLDYPDLTPTDLILLHLASLEYVKYLRVVQKELETGEVISQARQHPAVNMRGLLDQMGATRRVRNAGRKSDDNKDDAELRDALLSIGEN